MDLLEIILKYGMLPMLTAICTVGWAMYKKHDDRLEKLEERTNESEKENIEIKTAFRYVSRDIKEIKEMLKSLSER